MNSVLNGVAIVRKSRPNADKSDKGNGSILAILWHAGVFYGQSLSGDTSLLQTC